MQETVEVTGYRPVSKLAVAAAVAGILSALALMTPLLWLLPLVGVALAVAGLADVARPGAEKAGRAAALLGLALSIGFGTQAVSGKLVTRWITQRRSLAVAGAFLDAIRDDRIADVKSMLSQALLPGQEMSGMQPPSAEVVEAAIAAMPAVVAIRSCGEAVVRDVRSITLDDEPGERWGARVRLSPCAGGKPVDVRIEFDQSFVKERTGQVDRWTISKIEIGQ
ncbi:MAG: hypothetical protein HQ464_03920 [Planctomycetes bacterium]|nr:hypothetical protein [Planctomycetota bacterium]